MPGPACQLAGAPERPYVPAVAFSKWEDPAAVVRGILGGTLAVATLVLIVLWLSPGGVGWPWAAFVGTLWAFWALFNDVVNLIDAPTR